MYNMWKSWAFWGFREIKTFTVLASWRRNVDCNVLISQSKYWAQHCFSLLIGPTCTGRSCSGDDHWNSAAILCGHVFSLGKSMEMRCSTLFKPLNLGVPTSSQAHLTIWFMLGNLVVGLPVLFQVNLVLMQTGHIRDIMLYCLVNGCAINYEHPQ